MNEKHSEGNGAEYLQPAFAFPSIPGRRFGSRPEVVAIEERSWRQALNLVCQALIRLRVVLGGRLPEEEISRSDDVLRALDELLPAIKKRARRESKQGANRAYLWQSMEEKFFRLRETLQLVLEQRSEANLSKLRLLEKLLGEISAAVERDEAGVLVTRAGQLSKLDTTRK